VCEPSLALYALAMTRRFDHPPTLDEIERIAREALAGLPPLFTAHLGDVVLAVEDVADEAILAELGIDHPLNLSGVYEGIPIGERSSGLSGTLPDRIRLFRRALLEEWIEDGETLEHLVRHVLVHEVGHHFGLSDADMHAIEEQA
jgi:predicted Zn-dependent protease with MMP-like domain